MQRYFYPPRRLRENRVWDLVGGTWFCCCTWDMIEARQFFWFSWTKQVTRIEWMLASSVDHQFVVVVIGRTGYWSSLKMRKQLGLKLPKNFEPSTTWRPCCELVKLQFPTLSTFFTASIEQVRCCHSRSAYTRHTIVDRWLCVNTDTIILCHHPLAFMWGEIFCSCWWRKFGQGHN
jgi:hypothetical protein